MIAMARKAHLREEVFVVRIWAESESYPNRPWRACVTHIVTRERRYFSTYTDLCDFLDRCWEREGTPSFV
jgi:hypothetical protein